MARGAMGSNPPKTERKTPEQLGLRRLSNKRYIDGKGNVTDANGKILIKADKVESRDLGLTRLSQGIYQDMDGNRTDNKGNILPRDNQGNLQIGRPSQQQPTPVQQQPTPTQPTPVQPTPVQPAPTVNPNQITMGKGEFAQGTSFDKSALPGDFNWQTYVNNYEDLRKAGIDTENEALAHYYLHGRTEGRNYGGQPQQQPDTPPPPVQEQPVTPPPPPVQQQPAPTVNPNQITMGKGEFAQGTSFDKSALPGDFNWQTYVNNYEDLRKAGINTENEALAHYYLHGRTEGRNYGAPSPVQQQPTPTQPTPVEQPPVEEKPVPIVQDTTGGTGATGTGGGAAGGTGATGTGGDAAGATGGMVGNMGQRDERRGGAFGTNPTERNANPIYTAEGLFGSAGQFYTAENPKNIGSMVQPQFTQQMQQAGDAIYNEFSRRAEPEFERQRAALEQQMYERGLDPNSQGARLQMDQLMQQQNDARQSIRNQATQQAMAYQQQLFGQGQSIYGMPANIAATLGAPYLENLKAQTELQGRRELFQFEEGQQARAIEAENLARRENFANDLTKLATQFGNDERLLAQDIEGKLRLGNFDLEADLKKLAASSNNTVRELGVQLENDLAKIKASGAIETKNLKISGANAARVAGIGAGASERTGKYQADMAYLGDIMKSYNAGGAGGGGSTSAGNKFVEKLLEIGGPALVNKIFGS